MKRCLHFLALLFLLLAVPFTIKAQEDPCEGFMSNFFVDYFGNNLNVDFVNLSEGNLESVEWSFGDGAISTDYSIGHTYENYGTYTVCLSIQNDWCSSETCKTISIEPAPECEAIFVHTVDGETAYFDASNSNTNEGEILGYHWTVNNEFFEDDDPEFSFTFSESGVYDVCLLVYTNICEDLYCTEIVYNSGVFPECEAAFDFEVSGNVIFLNASASISEPGEIDYYQWYIDNQTFVDDDPDFSYVLPGTGSYDVCVLAANLTLGCEDEFCQEVVIEEPPVATCNASFWYELDGEFGFFNGFDSTVEPGEIDGQLWTVNGDGISDNSLELVYTFGDPGEYEVCLTIFTNAEECESTTCEIVIVEPNEPICEAFFIANVDGQSAELLGHESVSWTGNIEAYSWIINGQLVSDEMDPVYTFPEAGAYDVCLTIVTSDNCESVYCQEVFIEGNTFPECIANFSYQLDANVVFFDASSSETSFGSIDGYLWVVEGESYESGNPEFVYDFPANGVYDVCLLVWNNLGCEADFCDVVIIEGDVPPTCNANFWYELDGEFGFFNGFDSTVEPGEIDGQLWTVNGDGISDNSLEFVYTFGDPGEYEVCLTIYTNFEECENTTCQMIFIEQEEPACEAYFLTDLDGQFAYFSGHESISFTSDIIEQQWSVDGILSANEMEFAYDFPEAGPYEVCLTIFAADGCTSTYCEIIEIDSWNAVCEAVFTLEQDGPVVFLNANNSMSFTGNIEGYVWYGLGGAVVTETGPEYVYIYEEDGIYDICLSIITSDNCESEYCQTVVIETTPPAPECTAVLSYELEGNTIFLNASESSSIPGEINYYEYYIGNQLFVEEGPDFTYTFEENGVYEVCVLAANFTLGCEDVSCVAITIDSFPPAECEANFWYQQDGPGVYFNGMESNPGEGEIVGLIWTIDGFGVNNESLEFYHPFNEGGEYEVCLTIYTNFEECENTTCQMIFVEQEDPICEAVFTLEQDGPVVFLNANNSMSFTGNIEGYVWYGLGGAVVTETGPEYVYIYEEDGIYDICLSIITSDNCESEYCQTVVIETTPPAPECTAVLSYEIDGNTIFLNASESSSIPGEINYYEYYIGNQLFVEEGPEFTYTFEENGVYEVCVLAANFTLGCEDVSCLAITIDSFPPAECEANFWYQQDGPGVYFNGMGSNPGEGEIDGLIWEIDGFGVNNESLEFYHPFNEGGEYEVCLTIYTNFEECENTTCQMIFVEQEEPACEAYFLTDLDGQFGYFFGHESISFTSDIIEYQWSVDGILSANEMEFAYDFPEAGPYEVCLTVFAADGCTSTYCEIIEIDSWNALCQAVFTFEQDGPVVFLNGNGSESFTGNIEGYLWWLGGNIISDNGPELAYTFEENGVYEMCLSIFTSDICDSEYCQTIEINTLTSECTASFDYIAEGTEVQFINNSFSESEIVEWHWNFGNGLVDDNDYQPIINFENTDVYFVCLMIFTADGCESTYCLDVEVVNPCDNFETFFEYSINFEDNGLELFGFNEDADTWLWSVNGDPFAESQNTVLEIFEAGTYEICLAASNSITGCDSTYCQVVEVASEVDLRLQSNLVDQTALVDVTLVEAGVVELLIFNTNGERMYLNGVGFDAGTNQFQIDATEFSQGIFIIQARFENGEVLQRNFIKF